MVCIAYLYILCITTMVVLRTTTVKCIGIASFLELVKPRKEAKNAHKIIQRMHIDVSPPII